MGWLNVVTTGLDIASKGADIYAKIENAGNVPITNIYEQGTNTPQIINAGKTPEEIAIERQRANKEAEFTDFMMSRALLQDAENSNYQKQLQGDNTVLYITGGLLLTGIIAVVVLKKKKSK